MFPDVRVTFGLVPSAKRRKAPSSASQATCQPSCIKKRTALQARQSNALSAPFTTFPSEMVRRRNSRTRTVSRLTVLHSISPTTAHHSRTMALISISKTAHRSTNPTMRRSTRTAMEINSTTHRKATGSIRTTEAISSLSSMLRRRIKGCLTITASIISAMRIFRFDMPNNKKDLSDRLKSVG